MSQLHVLLYSILFALANNMDNIGVRIAYSIQGIRLQTSKNAWISAITFAVSTGFALLGAEASGFAGRRICSLASMLILSLIGLWFILEPYIKKSVTARPAGKKETLLGILASPEKSDMDGSKNIDFKEATLLGISLSINNAGGCLSAGMMGLNALLIGTLSALVSFLALWAGNYLTALFIRKNLGRKASVTAGVILILIGIRQLL